jgi:hypothetical protein
MNAFVYAQIRRQRLGARSPLNAAAAAAAAAAVVAAACGAQRQRAPCHSISSMSVCVALHVSHVPHRRRRRVCPRWQSRNKHRIMSRRQRGDERGEEAHEGWVRSSGKIDDARTWTGRARNQMRYRFDRRCRTDYKPHSGSLH